MQWKSLIGVGQNKMLESQLAGVQAKGREQGNAVSRTTQETLAKMVEKHSIARARTMAEGGASPAKVRTGMAGPLQSLKVRLLTIKIISVVCMPKRTPMGMVLNEVVPSDTLWSEVRGALVSAISTKTKRNIRYSCPIVQDATQFELALSGSDFLDGSEDGTVEQLWTKHTHPQFSFLHVSQKNTKDRHLPLRAVVWLPGPYAEALRGKDVFQDPVMSNGESSSLTSNFNSMASSAFGASLRARCPPPRQSPTRLAPKYATGQSTPTRSRRLLHGSAEEHTTSLVSITKSGVGRAAGTRLYSSMIIKTRTFVVDEYSILIDPSDCQAELVKRNSLPFELRVKNQEGTVYPYAAKELFQDETGQRPSFIGNKGHLLQELARVEQARDILDAFKERCRLHGVQHYPLEINACTLYEVALPPEQGRAWLVEPYIGLDPPRKFSGTDAAGHHAAEDEAGATVDCFAHFSLLYTEGTLVLVDLQGIERKNPFPGLRRDMPIVLFDVQTHTKPQKELANWPTKAGRIPGRFHWEQVPLPRSVIVTEKAYQHRSLQKIRSPILLWLPSVGSILLFERMANGLVAPAEVRSVDDVKKQATLKWCESIRWGEVAQPTESTFEATFAVCHEAMARLMDEWHTAMHAPGQIRTRSTRIQSESEWIKERQVDLYPHEVDAIADWLSYDVLPQCIKTAPDTSSDALRELGMGPGLLLGGLAVAICLLEKGAECFDLSTMYEQKHRLRRPLQPEVLRTWDVMLKAYLPLGSTDQAEFVETHQLKVDDWQMVVGGFHLANVEDVEMLE
ncbi:hypothetical protein CALCODRAFT_509436 [Calocera cornea HHB12733]|uniref:Alpha-type protein kinase domain-containing protein n=1 Tax=Calocera cornea HHB12733 TaxID=1353952 RepID=A0A165FA66_9BASI|nr:hypothetical protein CALCODRAFT_509436 [Calocera cornea HHB12733]